MIPHAIVWLWPDTPIAIAAILLIAVVVRVVVLRAIKSGTAGVLARARRRRESTSGRAARILAQAAGLASERHEARTATMGSLLRSVTNATIATLSILTILAVMEVPLAPLLASAGVGGVALGFGAQSLVKDYLSGIFMIVEDQYGVGDLIDTGQVTGTVEEVGLRVTRLRDGGGQVWYVRNGEIVRIGNQSQGWSTALIDIPVAHDEDPGRVIGILEGVVAEVDGDERWAGNLLEKPTVVGVQAISGGTMTVRIVVKTPPNKQWGVQRDILERSLNALNAAGVRGPVVMPGMPGPA
ncbi:MAG: mechanosensitive ion channel family protein [Micropruina sp.]|nr:mechanosensitive ion channel family protein [Micropruina sp.]